MQEVISKFQKYCTKYLFAIRVLLTYYLLKFPQGIKMIYLNFSLLSNAGLPETNPLLLDQDLDNSVSEDFQKMLNEWENHIGSLQVIYTLEILIFFTSETSFKNTKNQFYGRVILGVIFWLIFLLIRKNYFLHRDFYSKS